MAADDATERDDDDKARDAGRAETAARDSDADNNNDNDRGSGASDRTNDRSKGDRGGYESPEVLKLRAEVERLEKAQKETNRKAAADRKFREDFERAEEEKRRAQMSDLDRLRAEADDARQAQKDAEAKQKAIQAEKEDLRVAHAIEREANKAGFLYPEDVPDMLRKRGGFEPYIIVDTREIDEKQVKEAVERLIRERPGLVNAGKGGGTPPRDSGRGNLGRGPWGGRFGSGPSIEERMIESGKYYKM